MADDRPPLDFFVKRPPLDSFYAKPESAAAPAAEPQPLRAGGGVMGKVGSLLTGPTMQSAVKNLVPSAVQFGKDIAQPFMHPIETGESLFNLGKGILEKSGLKESAGNEKYAEAVGQHFVDRYGGVENVKHTLATDPVGLAGDLSVLLSGGGSLAARAPGALGKVGEITAAAGRAVDPLTPVIGAAKGAGALGSEVVGGLLTHTGGKPLREAYKIGEGGGAGARAFQENLRDIAPMEEAVKSAREGVRQLREERGEAYRSGIAASIGGETKPLSFDKVDHALADITQVKTFKGQILDAETQAIRGKIGEAVRDWKTLDPAEFHAAEGIDALKQKIGSIRDATQYGTPERVVADRAYTALRNTITKEFPEYGKVMKGYEEASKQIKEIEKTLSLNPNASIDTTLRKLQSALRDNVNTSFGRRKELADLLVRAGAPHLMERLTGQALKPWTPRGLAKLLGGEILAMKGAAMLPMMSPRLMGEAAYYAGKTAGNVPGRAIGKTAFQAGRVKDQLEPREMVRQDARAALRDKPQERYTSSEIDAMRAVARGSAPVDQVLQVKKMLERGTPQERISGAFAAYGGPQ